MFHPGTLKRGTVRPSGDFAITAMNHPDPHVADGLIGAFQPQRSDTGHDLAARELRSAPHCG